MDKDWNQVWKIRGKQYHSANAACPQARDAERDLLVNHIELRPGLTLLDVAAGGGYLLEKVHQLFGDQITCLAIESSDTFAAHLPPYVRRLTDGSITHFPLPDSSVDRVTNLSGLHHTADRHRFFAEAHRVLKPGGIIGAADVRKGSDVARWLNEFVDANNPDGHDGLFFEQGEMTRALKAAGFSNIVEETVSYPWTFDSEEHMVWFCRTLFGLQAGDETILSGITEFLGYKRTASGRIDMNWELIRAVAVR